MTREIIRELSEQIIANLVQSQKCWPETDAKRILLEMKENWRVRGVWNWGITLEENETKERQLSDIWSKLIPIAELWCRRMKIGRKIAATGYRKVQVDRRNPTRNWAWNKFVCYRRFNAWEPTAFRFIIIERFISL